MREVTIALVLAVFAYLWFAKLHPWLVWNIFWTYRRPTAPLGHGAAYIRYPLTPIAATCQCTGGMSPIVPAGKASGEHVCVSCGEAFNAGGQRLGYFLQVVRPVPRWIRLGKLTRFLSP